MKKILFILAPHNFRDEEYFNTVKIIEQAGYDHIISSVSQDKCISKFGKSVLVDIPLNQVDQNQFDAVIFVGGTGSEVYFQDKVAHSLAQSFNAAHKIVAAICFAPRILAEAGLLKDKKFTSYSSQVEAIQSQGGIFIESDVYQDNNLITANGPIAAEKFGQLIVKALEENEQTQNINH